MVGFPAAALLFVPIPLPTTCVFPSTANVMSLSFAVTTIEEAVTVFTVPFGSSSFLRFLTRGGNRGQGQERRRNQRDNEGPESHVILQSFSCWRAQLFYAGVSAFGSMPDEPDRDRTRLDRNRYASQIAYQASEAARMSVESPGGRLLGK